ncbi:MAG: GNAT family N-acetyltransferase, partial [Acidimicrobiales bacterium]|nr:GNAT family N-acetyltransferase [Acidimicrobiales bacterium]
LAVVGDRALAATATLDGAVAGVGYGVVDGAWLGIFGMATGPAHRRRGVARAVLGALVAAGRDAGATRAYLQVETDNVAAHALYAGLGFALHHRYHYRSEPELPAAPPLRSGSDAGADLC